MQTLPPALKQEQEITTTTARPKVPGGAALHRAEGLTTLGATSPQTTTLTCETEAKGLGNTSKNLLKKISVKFMKVPI